MLAFKLCADNRSQNAYIETSLSGKTLLNTTLLNKDTAFTLEEREIFRLTGKLPICVETLAQQVDRAYEQYKRYTTELSRNIYLNNLRDRNETLFYALLKHYSHEMLPIIYTPIVGSAVKAYSREFRSPRGLYINYEDRHQIDKLLQNRSHPEIDLIVVTDGEGVLGIGDQGIGGMDIPIAKLMLYSLFAGIHPGRTLPIVLDVGTNNETLLSDPLYLGARHKRISAEAYDDFIDTFIGAVFERFPNAYLHWEDLGQRNAWHILSEYRDKYCIFNDDIQGTGAVTLAGLMAAIKAKDEKLTEQKIVVFGAGSAGIGIVDQIYKLMCKSFLSDSQARERFWLIDRPGLLTTATPGLTPGQKPYAREIDEVSDWEKGEYGLVGLKEVIEAVKPTILIGCSAVPQAFNESIIRLMAKYCERPIIFPLSNPTERAEATPAELLRWTDGQALVATGSPFDAVSLHNQAFAVPQCNNALVFPGIGLGVLAVRANRLTDNMLWAACEVITEHSPVLQDPYAPVLPSLELAEQLSIEIAIQVGRQAFEEGVATVGSIEEIDTLVHSLRWEPKYLPLRKVDE